MARAHVASSNSAIDLARGVYRSAYPSQRTTWRRNSIRQAVASMIDVETVDAASTILLLEAIAALYAMLALIYVFLDKGRYHHVKLVQDLARLAGAPDQAAFHSVLLSASQFDRAVVGPHAQKRHPQQNLRNLRPISPTRRSISCAKKCPATGPNSAIRSPTISVSSIHRIFGF
jgi:hypothetical protein